MYRWTLAALLAALLLLPSAAFAAKPKKGKEAEKPAAEEKDPLNAGTFAGLSLRGIGPAVTSGRIGDLAVDPSDPRVMYVAAASGGVWKTANAGTTWAPIFDGQVSYSIGTVVLDPNNSNVVWVGTGENNSQRSVGYGDGVYKSLDGGKSWSHMGLKASEHIGKVVVDPRNSDVVYVAAQGPLWNPGGDRGLYKSIDGGKEWKKVLEVSENTGVSDLVFDPRNPDVLYAAAYQRRRHVWTLINGGPESALYKSTDAGATWRKVTKGLPSGDVGRIGLAISPIQPDVVYAVVEAQGDAGGFFRSADRGESWSKMGPHVSGSPQYYQELFADPNVFDRVYSVDTFLMVTHDGGKTFRPAGERAKHVDNHVVWINPKNSDHLLVGSDGGLYETFDRCATWKYTENLSLTQFYRVSADNSKPFYNVYGGTQDNFSLGGPSRTTSSNGITNADWFVTQGGDGFETVIDPTNPDILYAQAQYAGIVRYDKKSGETIDIQPQPVEPGEALRWNWDSPIIISPHSPTRLYYGANKLFRSDDRANTWRAVSGDLTRQLDRNQLEVMGKVWSVDAVAKNNSTSFYGNIVSLAESAKVEGLLYVGTDDGLVQVSEDAGGTWRKQESLPGVPERSYVSDLEASLHDGTTVYASFDNHKMGDFKPYVLKSSDRGRTWTSIAGNLPERGTVYTLAEDHLDPSLLFAGTEFGVFFSNDGGKKWVQLKGGMPPIAIRDIDIQRRENDLVLASFGRGFFVLDDYSPLRWGKAEALEKDATLLPVKDAWMFIERSQLGIQQQGFQGHTFFTAPNPPVGAVFTYYLKEGVKTRKERRQEAEKKAFEETGKVAYPSWDDLKLEDREEAPAILLTVSDEAGNVIRRLTGPASAGFNRISWDFRFPAADPVSLEAGDRDNPFAFQPFGPMAAPGTYVVSMARRVDGKVEPLGEPQRFEAVPLGNATLEAKDKAQLVAFQKKTSSLQRAVLGAIAAGEEAKTRLDHLVKAIENTPKAAPELGAEARSLKTRLADLNVRLTGDVTVARRSEPTPPAIVDRVQQVVYGHWASSSDATNTHRKNYDLAARDFEGLLGDLTKLIESDLAKLEAAVEAAGGPWTPGRVPRWKP